MQTPPKYSHKYYVKMECVDLIKRALCPGSAAARNRRKLFGPARDIAAAVVFSEEELSEIRPEEDDEDKAVVDRVRGVLDDLGRMSVADVLKELLEALLRLFYDPNLINDPAIFGSSCTQENGRDDIRPLYLSLLPQEDRMH